MLIKRNKLSPRELQIVKMLNTGLMQKEVAYALGITKKCVESHVASILKITDSRNIMTACYKLRKLGVITDEIA